MYATNQPTVLPVIAALCGVVSHLAYFIRGEHHKQAILFFKLAVLLPSTFCLILVHFFRLTFSQGAQLTGSITAAYLGALWTSMIIYRSFFHRLHRFPGPTLAKVSKFYHLFSIRKMDNYRKLEGWHQKYGRFVRIGKPIRYLVFGFGVLGLAYLVWFLVFWAGCYSCVSNSRSALL
jgi:hypothetical protein